jgi:hypothetical protein
MAVRDLAADALGRAPDAVERGDRRAPELHHKDWHLIPAVPAVARADSPSPARAQGPERAAAPR